MPAVAAPIHGLLVPCALVLAWSLSPAPAVAADFDSAVRSYQAGRMDEAFQEFLALAELGKADAQYNVGFMYLRGEGAIRSNARGYAWIKLAADGGNGMAKTLEAQLRPVFAEDAAAIVADIESRHGLAAVRRDQLPEVLPNCEYSTRTPPRLGTRTRVAYPLDAASMGTEGWMVVEFSIAPDGTAREYLVLNSNRADLWHPAVQRAMREWRWEPAMQDGRPVWSRHVMMFKFIIEDGEMPWLTALMAEIEGKAEAGDRVAQYTYAVVLAGHHKFRKPWSEVLPWIERSALSGYAPAEFQLGMSLLDGRGCRADRDKALFWLQRAAAAGMPEAQLVLAKELMASPAPVKLTTTPVELLRSASAKQDRGARIALARVLATRGDATAAETGEALKNSAAALKDDARNTTALETHAAALAAVGRFDDAVQHQQRALQFAGERGWALEPLQRRLQAYQGREAWRGPID